MAEKKWFVYLLECNDGSLYTGITTDIERRMKAHGAGTGSRYVSSRGFKQLLASQPCTGKSDAYRCEYVIKQLSREQKRAWFTL